MAARYLRILLTVLAGILGIVAGFNLLIDPYDVARLVTLPGINVLKPREAENARLRKPFDLWRRRYDGVILGTSQVEEGMDTANPALAAHGVTLYNGGLSEERPFEQALLLRHAVETSHVTFAIVSLDFLRYMGGGGQPQFMPPDWTRWHAVAEYLKTLVSAMTVQDSIQTVIANWTGNPTLQHLRDGQLSIEAYFAQIGEHAYRDRFNAIDTVYLNDLYGKVQKNQKAIQQSGFDHVAVRDMIATARKSGIRLAIYLSPSHARQFEILQMLGLGSLYQQWQAELACLVADEAAREPGDNPPLLWDFRGYNSVTTETVPPLNAETGMRWYIDPVHYSSATGRAIQDRILGFASATLDGIDDFGIALTPGGMAEHFRAVQARRRAYLAAHPDFFGALTALYREPARATVPPAAPPPDPSPCRPRAP
jgi:hypothetical protein